MNFDRELKYKDIILSPKLSELRSRSEASTKVQLGAKEFIVPVVPANMRTVISKKLANYFSENNYFYIMHRFDVDPVQFCEEVGDWQTVSISLGVQKQDKDYVSLLASKALKVDYVTVDIAHGHSILMKEMLQHIKSKLPNTFIIAGNIATASAAKDLEAWGADCIKAGIGQGHVCTTKDKTGFTRPMFSCVLECASATDLPVIADGGVVSNGDIAKALVAGAKMVMAGSLFSGCTNSPAASVVVNGKIYKQYFGSASEHNKGEKKHVEGVMREMPCNNMSYQEKLVEIKQDLQSAVSYAGGNDISCLKNIEWNLQ